MNTWNRMHRFIKIGLVVDFISMLVFVVGLVFGGSSIANVIGFSLLSIAIVLIATGAIKMRRVYHEYNS
jgi:hypothetical protein